ncbi:MAG: alpha/beta hydrolase [Alphaproteobacteria bacterium]|nr:alpha/beta hydrolase [Alphaproteobacteria bacterium]
MLPERFREPDGFQWGGFTDAGGAHIRYGSLQPEAPLRGTVVIASGFRECIEKYFEAMRDMTERGFAVWMMDWRGQGGSSRYLGNPQKMHSLGYEEHIETLRQFTRDLVKKSSGPFILLAHSMGAHIGLRFLKEHEGVFDAAVLTSPMCDVLTPGFFRPAAHALASLAKMAGCLEKYVPGGHDWDARDAAFEGNKVTSDPERFGVMAEIFSRKPELKMGSPTYGWAWHTFRSADILRKDDYLKTVATPILAGIAGNDMIVDIKAAMRACALLQRCMRVDVPAARHEIWMERDDLRAPWLEKVTAFLEDRVHAYRENTIHAAR